MNFLRLKMSLNVTTIFIEIIRTVSKIETICDVQLLFYKYYLKYNYIT